MLQKDPWFQLCGEGQRSTLQVYSFRLKITVKFMLCNPNVSGLGVKVNPQPGEDLAFRTTDWMPSVRASVNGRQSFRTVTLRQRAGRKRICPHQEMWAVIAVEGKSYFGSCWPLASHVIARQITRQWGAVIPTGVFFNVSCSIQRVVHPFYATAIPSPARSHRPTSLSLL